MAAPPTRVQRLLDEAAELSEPERVELAQALLRTIPADEAQREWVEEVSWRAERVLRGEATR